MGGKIVMEQMSLFANESDLRKEKQAIKRKWENAFQKWSNDSLIDYRCEPYGSCGYGSMCDWCEDNSYGRPCVRALNAMCREKRISIDYSDYDFKKVWGAYDNQSRPSCV